MFQSAHFAIAIENQLIIQRLSRKHREKSKLLGFFVLFCCLVRLSEH